MKLGGVVEVRVESRDQLATLESPHVQDAALGEAALDQVDRTPIGVGGTREQRLHRRLDDGLISARLP